MAEDALVSGGRVAAAVEDRKGSDDRLALLERAVAAVQREHGSIDALRRALGVVTAHDGWHRGHVYLPIDDARGAVRASAIRRDPGGADAAAETDAVHAWRREDGIHLAADVLRTQRALWRTDLQRSARLRRLHELGEQTLALFPVIASTRVVAVVELTADRAIRRDEAFVRVMHVLGRQLGTLMERSALQLRIARLAVHEEQRIAMELHDTVGQEATAIGILARMLHQELENRRAAGVELAGRLVDSIQNLKLHLRDFLSTIRSDDVAPGALPSELTRIAGRFARLGNCTCRVDIDETVEVGDVFAATQVARIAREATHNAVQHGHPRTITISLRPAAADEAVELRVDDDGIGVTAVSRTTGGLGQEIMRHRAGLLGAHLDVVAAPGGGVSVRCLIPTSALRGDAPEEVPA